MKRSFNNTPKIFENVEYILGKIIGNSILIEIYTQ